MNNGKVDWTGNFVAIATPFHRDGAIDEAAYKANIELLIEEGADGIVVAGCTGEAWSLEPEERVRLAALAKQVAGGKPVVLGTTGISAAKTLELSLAGIAAGSDGVLLMPPYYAVIKEREIEAYFKHVADGLKAPIFLYNMPKRTGINMSPAFLSRLSDLEWIVALKQSSNDFVELEQTLLQCGEKISVFAGHSAERGYAAVAMGCPGFVSSMEAQVMGAEAISLYRLAMAGNVEAGRRVQQRCIALDKGMRAIGTFPSNMKGAMNLLSRPGGLCRPPLLDLNEQELSSVGRVLSGLSLLEGERQIA